eukprot:Skav209836  [mRNA]  locus=scaffold2703:238324:265090:- [translate_table: standard]
MREYTDRVNALDKKTSHAIYSVVWSPDCEHILFACSSKIHLNSNCQAGQKQVEWKASPALQTLSRSFVNNTILSAGEDCRYKIWDAYGRLLFNSAPLDHVVTAVAWSPTGRETPDVGSIFSISWCNDGTQLACGTGSGHVVFGSLVDRSCTWQNMDVTLDENNTITVDGPSFPSKVRCPHHFALVDAVGIQIINYEGRQLSTIKMSGLRYEYLNHQTLSVFDVFTGRAMGLYQHFEKGQWEQAVRLCRYVKTPELWASLAVPRCVNFTTKALAAIEEVDKVQCCPWWLHVPDDVLRSAELALFCKRPDEAERLCDQPCSFLQFFVNLRMNIRLHRWNDALELAKKHQTHVDTVLAYRQQHLQQMKHVETNDDFKHWGAEVPVDWETVKRKIALEKEGLENSHETVNYRCDVGMVQIASSVQDFAKLLAMTRIRTGIARRPDGPEDANPMNRRLPAEVVSRRKRENRAQPGKAVKEEAAPSHLSTDLKQVLAMKPEARSKWLAKAVQQGHPQDGRLSPKSIYDIIAHAKFANDLNEKMGQRMYRVLHANLSLFSTKQQKFLEKECSLAKQPPVRSGALQRHEQRWVTSAPAFFVV